MEIRLRRVLVVSPHTDDMELGAGGTIRKLIQKGIEVRSLVFSDCKESIDASKYEEDILRKECLCAAQHLRIDDIEIKEIPVREFPTHRQDILEALYSEKEHFKPDLVFTTWINDIHQDHRTVAEESKRAFMRSSISLCSYQVPGTCLGFNANLFIPLSEDEVTVKAELLQSYKTQIGRRDYFKLEKIRAFLRYFGTFIREDYAEPFVLDKGVINGIC